MDDQDAKLIHERTQLLDLLTSLRQVIGALPVERLAGVLPMLVAPCAELERVARHAGILDRDPGEGGSLIEPISGASILP